MKKKVMGFILMGSVMAALAGCGKTAPEAETAGGSTTEVQTEAQTEAVPATVNITHQLGTVEVPVNPQRVAVLDLAALDIMDALELGDRVVGIPKKSSVSYLTAYLEDDSIINVGSVKEVDMEALNSLEPDLIVIGGRLSSEYEAISKIAPTILISVDHEIGYMESFQENVRGFAGIFEKEAEAEALISGFEERIETLKAAAEGKTAIVGIVTSGSLSTLGNGSRCSLITNEVGFTNAASDVDSTHGDTASFEYLLERNPEYMFILDRDTAINAEGAKVAKEVMTNEIVMKTDAFQNDKIIYLTPDVWYLSEGGITATDTMLKDLEAGILK